jgi:hypothetical protein
MRGAHPQHAFRFGAATCQLRFSLIDFSQDALGSFQQVLPLFGQGRAASAASDKAHFGPMLQRRQPLADDAKRKAHLPAGGGQASRCHDPNEGA